MPRWRTRTWLLPVLLSFAAAGWSGAVLASLAPPPPSVAGFAPATLQLGPGQSATVQLTADGLSPGDLAAQFRIAHDRTRSTFSQPSCVGGWAGADALLSVDTSNTWLGCVYLPGAGPATATSGPVMSVTITNLTGDAQDLTLNPAFTYFLLADETSAEFPARLVGLALRPPGTATATATSLPTGTASLLPLATGTATPPPTATATLVPTRTSIPTEPPTATATLLVGGPPPATPTGTPERFRPPTETPGCEARVRVGNREYWAPEPATVCGTPPARGSER